MEGVADRLRGVFSLRADTGLRREKAESFPACGVAATTNGATNFYVMKWKRGIYVRQHSSVMKRDAKSR